MATTPYLSPFLNSGAPATGGTTTQQANYANFNPTPTIGSTGLPGGLPAPTGSTSTAASIPLGSLAKSPTQNLAAPSNTLPSNQTLSPYQQNLARYNLTSIPQGYSFAANGKLTNNAGQEYVAPTANNSTGTSTTTAPPPAPGSTNPANPLTKAPAGMEYGPTGLLQPIQGYSASNPATYPGLINQVANTASAPTTQYTQAQNTAATAAGGLLSSGAAPSQAFLDAQAQAKQALSDLTASRQNEANALSLNSQNPIPLEFQQGRGQVLQNQYLQQQNAYAQQYAGAVAQEQAATGQQSAQQAGFQGAGNVANTSAGAATGQQGTQIGGLGTAASLAAPQQAGPTNLPFNPATGQYGTPAANSYGTGGLQTVGNIAGQIGVGQNVAQLNSALGGAQVVGNNLNDLITQNNINPMGLTYANGALQFGAAAMSNPAYQKFAGQINDFIASLAPILGAGGNITDMKTQMSSQIVNALQSGSTIKDVVSYFLDQAKQKVQGMSAGGGAGVGSAPSSNTGSSNFYSQNWFQ